jgi:putative membrane protein
VFATLLVAVVAVIHLYILVLEMFLWNTKTGQKAFNLSADFARETRVLAANQGLYNGFLAAGLLWGLWLGERGVSVIFFFLICILVAGIFGAVTASRKILYVQALPALAAIVALIAR